MACIIYRTNKNTGVTYAYSSESYRDPITKQPKSKRTYLGRLDPETNKIVPKGEEGTHSKVKLTPVASEKVMPVEISDLIDRQRTEIRQLQAEIDSLKKANETRKQQLATISKMINDMVTQCT